MLCLWEALTNAVEHGSSPGDTIDVSLTANRDGALVAEIRDRGRALTHSPQSHRGFGMVLMRSLMDDVVRTSDELGTTVRMRLRCPTCSPQMVPENVSQADRSPER